MFLFLKFIVRLIFLLQCLLKFFCSNIKNLEKMILLGLQNDVSLFSTMRKQKVKVWLKKTPTSYIAPHVEKTLQQLKVNVSILL